MVPASLHVVSRAPAELVADETLVLPFEKRGRSRFRATLRSGTTIEVMLPRGTILRGGDKLLAGDGRVIEVVAAPEDLLEVRGAGVALARIAYHLGNRHVAVAIGEGCLRLAEDHVLEAMVRGLGAEVAHVHAPFEPEAGAYAHSHALVPTARIHDFSTANGTSAT